MKVDILIPAQGEGLWIQTCASFSSVRVRRSDLGVLQNSLRSLRILKKNPTPGRDGSDMRRQRGMDGDFGSPPIRPQLYLDDWKELGRVLWCFGKVSSRSLTSAPQMSPLVSSPLCPDQNHFLTVLLETKRRRDKRRHLWSWCYRARCDLSKTPKNSL